MTIIRTGLRAIGVLLPLLALSSVASAQATRTWISGVGDDANPCSRTAPCKTFAGAISKTAPSGEIDCLDPGGFGALTITKAITLDCHGALDGGVLVSGTNGLVVAAGAGDVVTIRNMNIVGLNSGLTGIHIISAKTVHIQGVNIYGFVTNGVDVAASANTILTMKDCRIHEFGGAGIQTGTSSGAVVADFDNVSIFSSGAGTGISAQNGSHLTLQHSTIFGTGIAVSQSQTGGGSTVMVAASTFDENALALQSATSCSIGVSGSVFSGNATVYNSNGGSISSGGDNSAFGNGVIGLANGTGVTKI